jgi:hypothetical protein
MLNEVFAVLENPVSQWVRDFLVYDHQLSDVSENHDVKLNKWEKDTLKKLANFITKIFISSVRSSHLE